MLPAHNPFVQLDVGLPGFSVTSLGTIENLETLNRVFSILHK